MSNKGLEREVDVSDIVETSANFKIHGVVNSLSPMKKAKNCSYFDGEISDGKARMRLFGFDANVRKRLADEEDAAVSLCNCEVKRSRQGDQLEVCLYFFG